MGRNEARRAEAAAVAVGQATRAAQVQVLEQVLEQVQTLGQYIAGLLETLREEE